MVIDIMEAVIINQTLKVAGLEARRMVIVITTLRVTNRVSSIISLAWAYREFIG